MLPFNKCRIFCFVSLALLNGSMLGIETELTITNESGTNIAEKLQILSPYNITLSFRDESNVYLNKYPNPTVPIEPYAPESCIGCVATLLCCPCMVASYVDYIFFSNEPRYRRELSSEEQTELQALIPQAVTIKLTYDDRGQDVKRLLSGLDVKIQKID